MDERSAAAWAAPRQIVGEIYSSKAKIKILLQRVGLCSSYLRKILFLKKLQMLAARLPLSFLLTALQTVLFNKQLCMRHIFFEIYVQRLSIWSQAYWFTLSKSHQFCLSRCSLYFCIYEWHYRFFKVLEEHIIHVQNVVKKLTKVNLILNADKCHFTQTSV